MTVSPTSRPGAGRSFFVADLHLTDERPAATGRFFRFLDEAVDGADALYILGDLFEAWTGDDHDERVAHDAARKLKALAESGTQVFFMHGNRDFMLAERYALQSGMTLVADPARIDLYGVPTLLMHGDTLCTDDVEYQQFRAHVRDPETQRRFLAMGIEQRIAMARQLRDASRERNSQKAEAIMDVNQDAVANVMRRHGVRQLIHGHTHRPAVHDFELDGHAARRIVLGDWYEQGSVLRVEPSGMALDSL